MSETAKSDPFSGAVSQKCEYCQRKSLLFSNLSFGKSHFITGGVDIGN